jgi:hypothetical protein
MGLGVAVDTAGEAHVIGNLNVGFYSVATRRGIGLSSMSVAMSRAPFGASNPLALWLF